MASLERARELGRQDAQYPALSRAKFYEKVGYDGRLRETSLWFAYIDARTRERVRAAEWSEPDDDQGEECA